MLTRLAVYGQSIILDMSSPGARLEVMGFYDLIYLQNLRMHAFSDPDAASDEFQLNAIRA